MPLLSTEEIQSIREEVIGYLDRTLSVVSKSVVKDKLGKTVETWATLLENLPCMVESVRDTGTDDRGTHAPALYLVKFTLGNYYPQITESCRISFEGRTYAVRAIPRQTVNILTELIAEEVVS